MSNVIGKSEKREKYAERVYLPQKEERGREY